MNIKRFFQAALASSLMQTQSQQVLCEQIKRNYKTGGPLTVHVVPHSHDDIGWRKTIDEYFDGSNKDKQWTNVQIELTTVMEALLQNPQRKFSEVEMKFFSMWWKDQNQQMKDNVKKLIKNGQLELINGGWSMHDEACPIYEDMIDNMKIGHDFILNEFGIKPRIGWQIDPFGHSNTNARIFAEMGFDAFFFARIDYQDKNKRMNESSLEWVWIPNKESLGRDVNIFTHSFYGDYGSPDKFDFDVRWTDTFIIDENSDTFNADVKAQQLIEEINQRSQHYLTDEIFVVFGEDFQYMNAFQNYQNMDNMINYMNKHYSDKFIFRYSTPSDYVDAIRKYNVSWPTKYDDMFPYSDLPTQYWTGYFTSRANSKGYARTGSSFMHASNLLYVEKIIDQSTSESDIKHILESSFSMHDAIGINQHHDAITGTADQYVANDYASILYKAMIFNKQDYTNIIQNKIESLSGYSSYTWEQCFKTNSTYLDCPVAKQEIEQIKNYKMAVAIQNPSPVDQNMVKIPVPNGNYNIEIFDPIQQQFLSLSKANASVFCYDDTLQNGTQIESCFAYININLPSKSISLLTLEENKNQSFKVDSAEIEQIAIIQNDNIALISWEIPEGSEYIDFMFNNKKTNQTEILQFSLKYWISQINYNTWVDEGANSGVYLFNPKYSQKDSLFYTKVINASRSIGHVGRYDIHFGIESKSNPGHFYKEALVHVTIPNGFDVIQFEVDLKSLPGVNYEGHEVVVNFKLQNFTNNQTFYTDSNGLEMQKRILNYRPTWDIQANYNDSNENITANYYPINSAISIKDIFSDRVFTVMNDRSQGGSSLSEGNIELMQNRFIPANDHLGNDEYLTEMDENGKGIRVVNTYYVQIFQSSQSSSIQRQIQLMTSNPLQAFYSFDLQDNEKQGSEDILSQKLKESGLNGTIDYVLTPLARNKFEIRVENIGDLYDGGQKQQFNLRQVADALWQSANKKNPIQYKKIIIEEKSLTGNMNLSEMQERKVQWLTVDDEVLEERKLNINMDDWMDAEPQRIRVFYVEYLLDDHLSYNSLFLQ